jgi:hypothetical protein
MQFKLYKNEIIIVLSICMLFGAFIYKKKLQDTQKNDTNTIILQETKKIIALKKVWADKSSIAKIRTLKNIVPSSKVKWNQKSKKLSVSFLDLSPKEFNSVITKIMNLPIEIIILEVKEMNSKYTVEMKCKW